MKTVLTLVLVSMVILPCFSAKKSGTPTDFDGETDSSENIENGLVDDIPKTNYNEDETTQGPQNKPNKCCEIGNMLATLGLQCNKYRFSRAHRHAKLRLVNTTLEQVGIHVTLNNRNSLYLPFRVCALRNSYDIDKCCVYNQHMKGSHNNMDLGYDKPSARLPAFDNHKHYRSGFNSNRFTNRREHFGKSHSGHYKSSGHKSRYHKDNYKWDTWPQYRSYRSQHSDTLPSRHASYRNRRHMTRH